MSILQADFITSAINPKFFPVPIKPSFCCIGRSNVGKSSLINLLLNKKNLARVSKKPGKTQKIHFYYIDKTWYFIDLPGYGWAKVNKTLRTSWPKMIKAHLGYNPSLVTIFLLIDASILPQPIDLDYIQWLSQQQLPFVIVLTKADKKKRALVQANIFQLKKAITPILTEVPKIFITSVADKIGHQELLSYIQEHLLAYGKPAASLVSKVDKDNMI